MKINADNKGYLVLSDTSRDARFSTLRESLREYRRRLMGGVQGVQLWRQFQKSDRLLYSDGRKVTRKIVEVY